MENLDKSYRDLANALSRIGIAAEVGRQAALAAAAAYERLQQSPSFQPLPIEPPPPAPPPVRHRRDVHPSEAAEMLGVSRSMIWRLVRAGKLEAYGQGRGRWIRIASLEKYQEAPE